VLLDGEGTGVEGPFVTEEVVLGGGQDSGHENTHGQGQQGDNRVTDADGCLAKVEELVDEGDDAGPEQTKEPHAEGVVWQGGVIGVYLTGNEATAGFTSQMPIFNQGAVIGDGGQEISVAVSEMSENAGLMIWWGYVC